MRNMNCSVRAIECGIRRIGYEHRTSGYGASKHVPVGDPRKGRSILASAPASPPHTTCPSPPPPEPRRSGIRWGQLFRGHRCKNSTHQLPCSRAQRRRRQRQRGGRGGRRNASWLLFSVKVVRFVDSRIVHGRWTMTGDFIFVRRGSASQRSYYSYATFY